MDGFSKVDKEIKIAQEPLNKDTAKQMEKCLQELTTSGNPSLDAKDMKKFKHFCRESDDYVRFAFLLIMRQLNKKHSEIRLSAFQVADELFNRSHAFREILVTHLQAFLALTTETETERPLPPPKSAASKLKIDALHALQNWYEKYGQGYKKLSVGYNYLKNCKHVNFSDIRAQNQAERQRIENEEKRKQKIMADKLVKVLKDISELKPEIEDCAREAESCLQLLLPSPTYFSLPMDEGSDQLRKTSAPDTHPEIQEYLQRQPDVLFNNSKDIDANENCGSAVISRPDESPACSTIVSELPRAGLPSCSDNDAVSEHEVSGQSVHHHHYIRTTKNENKDGHMSKLHSLATDNSVSDGDKPEGKEMNTLSEPCVFHEENARAGFSENGIDSDIEHDDMEEDDMAEDDLHAHGLPNPSFSLVIDLPVPGPVSVQVTTDNKDVICSLKDASKLITNRYLPKVMKWLEVLGKNGATEKDIKAAIDLKIILENIKEKCLELKLVSMDTEQLQDEDVSDADEFEDVPEKEGYEPHIPKHLRTEYGLGTSSVQTKATASSVKDQLPGGDKGEPSKQIKSASVSKHWSLKDRIKAEDVSDPTSLASALAKIRSESSGSDVKNGPSCSGTLHSISGTLHSNTENKETTSIPVVEFGSDLAYWENPDKIEAPSVVKLDSLHRFWAPKETESEKPSQHDIAAVKNRTFYFTGKFEPVKWKCRAKLPSGKLCDRMDRVKCPFHGKIIPRDKDGNSNGEDQPSSSQDDRTKPEPVEENSEELPAWQDPELQREIEQATGHDLGSARSQKLLEKKKGKGKGKGKKKSNLTDIESVKNTPRKRLEGKIFNKRSMKRVCSTLDNADYKRVRDKFANQFSYSLH